MSPVLSLFSYLTITSTLNHYPKTLHALGQILDQEVIRARLLLSRQVLITPKNDELHFYGRKRVKPMYHLTVEEAHRDLAHLGRTLAHPPTRSRARSSAARTPSQVRTLLKEMKTTTVRAPNRKTTIPPDEIFVQKRITIYHPPCPSVLLPPPPPLSSIHIPHASRVRIYSRVRVPPRPRLSSPGPRRWGSRRSTGGWRRSTRWWWWTWWRRRAWRLKASRCPWTPPSPTPTGSSSTTSTST
jgi:hypothetical protein